MEDLITRVSAAAGIEPNVAQKSIGIILNFLRKEGPSGAVAQVMQGLPGAQAAADAAASDSGGGGLMGGLAGMMGGGGGLMALAGQLSAAGLGMGEMQAVGKELFAAAQEKAGPDAIGAIAGAIPGLSQFI